MMRCFRQMLRVLSACGALIFSPALFADNPPELEIDELTDRIKVEGESADLLLQRAIEYNVLRNSAQAVKDLEKALLFEPRSTAILRELSKSYFSVGKTNEALDTAARGLKSASEGSEKASLYVVRAGILRAQKEYAKALDDLEKALHEHPDNVEGYLARSQLQQALDMKKERTKGLEQGIKETGSGLLEWELIDALIEYGKTALALEKIETGLSQTRLRSSWLIRRAKVFMAEKKTEEGKADLKEAIEELNKRLGRAASDPLLLADRGQANELLGNKEDAKKDYEGARDKGITDEWLRERIKALGGSDRRGSGRGRRGEGRRGEEAKEEKDAAGDKPDDKAEKPDDKAEKPDDKPEEKPGTD
jgi:tetratricopeptide (TPR) repeat protein